MARILVIDLGTSYFKTALFDREGRLCGVCRAPTPIRPASDGLVEIVPAAFEQAVADGIGTIAQQAGGLDDVQAVTFATQTNSIVLLDRNRRPLTPIVLWPDRRASQIEDEVRRRGRLSGFRAATGVPQLGYQFMVARLLWFRRHEPTTWARLDKLCLISDYLTLLLTGRHVTEAGAAALTGLVDIRRCQWWPEMLSAFEINPSCLAEVARAGTDLGQVDAEAARRFALPASCRVVMGCLDQYAGAIGAGNFEPGSLSETTGTVLATVRCTDRLTADLDAAVFCGPAFAEGLYYQMVFGETSANYLDWYRQQLPDQPSFECLGELAGKVAPGAGGLRLRTNVPMTRLADVFEGMTEPHCRGRAVRCIMEAVAYALRDQVRALAGEDRPTEIHSAGGAARSDLWLQIKADVLGATTMTTQCPETVSLGAAILAEAGLSGRGVPSVGRQWVRLGPPHRPDPQRHALYLELTGSDSKSRRL